MAAALMALLLPGLLERQARQRAIEHAFDAVGRSPPIVMRRGAALALPSGQANVRLYLVQSDPSAPVRR